MTQFYFWHASSYQSLMLQYTLGCLPTVSTQHAKDTEGTNMQSKLHTVSEYR